MNIYFILNRFKFGISKLSSQTLRDQQIQVFYKAVFEVLVMTVVAESYSMFSVSFIHLGSFP